MVDGDDLLYKVNLSRKKEFFTLGSRAYSAQHYANFKSQR